MICRSVLLPLFQFTDIDSSIKRLRWLLQKLEKFADRLRHGHIRAKFRYYLTFIGGYLNHIGNYEKCTNVDYHREKRDQESDRQSPQKKPPPKQKAQTKIPASDVSTKSEKNTITVKGHGTQMSNLFGLNKSMVAVKYNHSGKGRFAVELYNAAGNLIKLINDKSGPVNGSMGIPINVAGQHYINVYANPGAGWWVTISKPILINPYEKAGNQKPEKESGSIKIQRDKNGVIKMSNF